MITNKRFDDPSYKGWVLPETCDDINGTPLERHYDTTKTKSETRKSVSAAIDFWVVLNMFTIPKVMFSKNLQLFFCKIL